MDSDGETIYRVPQFNMVAHGAGHVNDGTNEGQITKWVRIYLNTTYYIFAHHKFL